MSDTAAMAATFHLFPDLPVELRVHIWRWALEGDYIELNGRKRVIELHHYSPKKKEIRVTVSRRYPTLFDVSCEARFEAGKAGGGEWVTVSDVGGFDVVGALLTMNIILTFL
jgi:hypothetical protein